jgi:hypothetical protein
MLPLAAFENLDMLLETFLGSCLEDFSLVWLEQDFDQA